LVEAVVLAATSGVAGAVLARWSLSVLLTSVVSGVSYISAPSINSATLGWTAALVLGTAMLFGMAPAWRLSVVDLASGLRGGRHGALSGAAGRRPLRLLVIAEIALTLVLATGGTLLIRGFVRMRQEPPGFVADHVLTFRLAPSGAAYATERRLAAFYTQVLDRVGALPGVAVVGAIDSLPIVDAGSYLRFSVEGRGDTQASTPSANYRIVSPTYFTTLGIQLRKGRAFSKYDTADSGGVILVNEALVREIFPSDDPIGKRVAFGGTRKGTLPWLEIVGVVGDVRTNGLSMPVKPEAYRPYTQAPWPGMTFVVRTEGRPQQPLAGIRSSVAAIDPGQPLASITTLDDVVAGSLSRPRFQAWLMTTFSAFALALVALGMYGVTTYTVAQRTHEFGVRLALGASPRALLRSVVGEALGAAAVGLLIGVAGMLAGARVIASVLESSAVLDASAVALAATVVIFVTLAASVIPARRVMRVDPIITLRDE
jgi:putative ABC transport system permease protein